MTASKKASQQKRAGTRARCRKGTDERFAHHARSTAAARRSPNIPLTATQAIRGPVRVFLTAGDFMHRKFDRT